MGLDRREAKVWILLMLDRVERDLSDQVVQTVRANTDTLSIRMDLK